MARDVQDHYFRLAKKEGYLSRAAYKLIEIDDRRKILRRGDCVLDCGAAPGSWLQAAAKRVGPRGVVVGIDLKPITHAFTEANVRTVVGDVVNIAASELLGDLAAFDVILSDMAPSTTGVPSADHHHSVRLCEALLDRCKELLRPGGTVCMKVFEGEAYPALLSRTKAMFETVKGFKPKATRGESREMYIVATGYRR
jgi:23S rRNA (uridine2552-2'-O)-methyltransferase